MSERLASVGSGGAAPAAPRGQPRRKTFLPVTLSIGDQRYRAHMLNLSTGGACVHVARAPLRVWHAVGVEVAGRAMPGRLSWVDGERCGVRFAVPLTASDVEQLIG